MVKAPSASQRHLNGDFGGDRSRTLRVGYASESNPSRSETIIAKLRSIHHGTVVLFVAVL
jgi:hypothetical protein